MSKDKFATGASSTSGPLFSELTKQSKDLTVKEFKMWLAGFIQGMNGKVPDVKDWEVIKQMLDRVKDEPTVVERVIPTVPSWPSPTYPSIPSWPTYPTYPTQPFWVSPDTTGNPPPGLVPSIWCAGTPGQTYAGNNSFDYNVTSITSRAALTQCAELSERLKKDTK